ncbi:hypothetical protein OJ253_379 [Cryptosporidium canis]|uniref:RNA-polymerase II-associated protein 3-like C-terminal domain-containing protein n=1 Tax=Cryptosporidium canis TaxID=195482 RepID=A0A9D5DPZ2_9CRYT|nr:hypothetical protein OJ253_379 [Cryptosporidium canis]
MEEFNRIPIVIVGDEDELEKATSRMDEEESQIDPGELIERMKENGGRCYRERRFDTAFEFYSKGLEILGLEQSLNEKGRELELVLKEVVLKGNCIACYVEKKDFRVAISESRKLIQYIKEEEASYLRENADLPTLWVSIKNKTMYRLSFSLYSLFSEKSSICDEGSEAHIRESFDAISTVLRYYQEGLKVPPPQEVTALYNRVKAVLDSQSTNMRDCNANKETGESQTSEPTEREDRREASNPENEGGPVLKKEESHYLGSYIECFIEEGLEPGSRPKTVSSPIPVIDKMSCKNSMEFLRIWQNICQNDRFLDYYLLFGRLFMDVDQIFSRTEMEINILDKTLERISAILDETIKICPSGPKDNMVSQIFMVIQRLERTARFDFVVLMLPRSFQILDKLINLSGISDGLLQEVRRFRDDQASKGVCI